MTIAHLEDFVRLMQCLHLIRTILKRAWRRRILSDYPLREKLPLLPEPVVQNELTTDERDTFLASFDNQTGFRSQVMSAYVLLTPAGKPYSESTIKRYFKTAKAIAGITRRFRLHDQRHTFESTLASKVINSFTLRDLLGHTSTRTTERYARPSTETLAAVAAALT